MSRRRPVPGHWFRQNRCSSRAILLVTESTLSLYPESMYQHEWSFDSLHQMCSKRLRSTLTMQVEAEDDSAEPPSPAVRTTGRKRKPTDKATPDISRPAAARAAARAAASVVSEDVSTEKLSAGAHVTSGCTFPPRFMFLRFDFYSPFSGAFHDALGLARSF